MKKQNAFTLAELLVSILIISVILTLLAPVITKKVKSSISVNNGSSNSSGYNSKLYIYNKLNPECSEISGVNNSLSCNFTIPSGVKKINAIAVSGGGGGAGATQPSIEYSKTLNASTSEQKKSTTKEIVIDKNMKNFVISELIGSGAGGGGAAWAESSGGPQSQSDCDPYNALFIPAAYNGLDGKNLCVTKYNVGDTNGPTIASTTRVTETMKIGCKATECCWKGVTSDSCTSKGSWGEHSTSYSGCTRTVCTWSAANNSCQSWAPSGTKAGDWRLPQYSEILGWFNVIKLETEYSSKITKYLGSDGLQLCVEGEPDYHGSIMCGRRKEYCSMYDRGDGKCLPSINWTGTPQGNYHYVFSIGNVTESYESTLAFSARCVLESGLSSNTVSSGGGGGAGAYIKNYQIPNDVISSNIGGKIKLFSAAGGSGGSSASSSGSSASNGTSGLASYVEVYAPDGVTLVWGIRALGGNYGYGASSTDYGNGGAQTSANSCQLYENGVWRSINCTGVGIKGTNGNKVESASSTNTATGGSGGGSMYNSSTVIGGGSGGSISSANGYNGSVYGAGGGGATIVFDSSNNVTKGIGGNGANGVAEITYDLVYSAAAGGGGGGGAYVELSDISVSSGNTYTIKVGNGGSGGSISTKGSDGGESEIVFDSITYTLSGGKGGQIGTSATSTTNVIQGIGGSGGIVSSNVSDTTNIKYKNGSKGEDGGSFTKDDTHSNSTNYGGSYGGVGGVSGIDTKGSCSGLFIDSSICSNTTVNGITNTFVAPIINNTAIDYGQAGAGGGGGGWSENTILYPNPGSGSQGQGGYVFIYWRE